MVDIYNKVPETYRYRQNRNLSEAKHSGKYILYGSDINYLIY